MNVLLISARPAVTAQVTTALLGLPGAEIVEVPTPKAALHELDGAGPFDIVIADNDTHPVGGFFLAREVAGRREMGATLPPVVLLLARHQDAWLARWSGASAFVVKPVDPFDLAEVVEALVEGSEVPALPGVGGQTAQAHLQAGPPAGAP